MVATETPKVSDRSLTDTLASGSVVSNWRILCRRRWPLLGLAGWLASRRVAHPVLALAAAADRIAQGDSSDKLPAVEGSREVSLLTGSLRALLAKLQGREAALAAR